MSKTLVQQLHVRSHDELDVGGAEALDELASHLRRDIHAPATTRVTGEHISDIHAPEPQGVTGEHISDIHAPVTTRGNCQCI